MTPYEKVDLIDRDLREIFREKDRIVGIEEWNSMIGILILLGQLKADLQTLQLQQNTPGAEEVNDNGR